MSAFKCRTEIAGIALCGLFMATLACTQSAAGMPEPAAPDSEEQLLPDDYDPGCMEETTIRIAGRDEVITVHEAEEIRQIVLEYLEREKPVLEPSVYAPTKAFINCQGSVRMGAWMLWPGSSDKPELDLAFYVLANENFRVWQRIGLIREEGRWRVTGVGRKTAHLRY